MGVDSFASADHWRTISKPLCGLGVLAQVSHILSGLPWQFSQGQSMVLQFLALLNEWQAHCYLGQKKKVTTGS